MTVSSRTTGLVAVAFFLALVPPALAQTMPRPQIMQPQGPAGPGGAYNMGVLGTGSASPFQLGYGNAPSAFPQGPALAGPRVPNSPYGLSTVGGYNPYFGGFGAMDASPYSLSTVGGGGVGGIGGGAFFPGFGGFTPNSMGYGYGLMGIADYTRASGQYWKDIQSARMTQEQVRQTQIETARRRVMYEAWYETMRPTAAKMRDVEMAASLDRARKDPPDGEITSGRALNILLASVQKASRAKGGDSPALSEDVVKRINLSGGSTNGSASVLKEVGKLEWPEAFQEQNFDEARKRLSTNLKKAVDGIKDGDAPAQALLRDINSDFKEMNDKLNTSADEMPVNQFIEGRRFMNQLASGIKALRDPNVGSFLKGSMAARGRNVADLVSNMTSDGLSFGPAAAGDESAYKAVYIALRNYESSLQGDR